GNYLLGTDLSAISFSSPSLSSELLLLKEVLVSVLYLWSEIYMGKERSRWGGSSSLTAELLFPFAFCLSFALSFPSVLPTLPLRRIASWSLGGGMDTNSKSEWLFPSHFLFPGPGPVLPLLLINDLISVQSYTSTQGVVGQVAVYLYYCIIIFSEGM